MPFEHYAPYSGHRITPRGAYIDQLLFRTYNDLLYLNVKRLTIKRYLLLDRRRK